MLHSEWMIRVSNHVEYDRSDEVLSSSPPRKSTQLCFDKKTDMAVLFRNSPFVFRPRLFCSRTSNEENLKCPPNACPTSYSSGNDGELLNTLNRRRKERCLESSF
ncbi:hypothetical protein JTE90_016254 [Oedothorax gibbosus]|uniref:Uncharacterized protein n=1 Tax=Oedothorax gibbosus TaxID=931172 RepID=A0AAV6VQZ3_9ARAC|nr:hypothetical protein JTE90_016254 [Oedothorax gibbosus]